MSTFSVLVELFL